MKRLFVLFYLTVVDDLNDISMYGMFSIMDEPTIVDDPIKVLFRERECSTCLFFDRTLFDGFELNAGPGYCRRYPPSVYSVEAKPVKQTQPVVSPWEWCGEWQKA